MFYPKNPKRPNGQSANMAHFVAFFISFQKIIPSKIPPGGGGGQGLLVALGLKPLHYFLRYYQSTRVTIHV